MKKTLSLLLALVLVLGSFSSVFAAKPETDVEVAELLQELGILLGNASGDLMLDKDLNRAEAIVLLSRLMKAEDTAKKFPVDDLPFDDIASELYQHYVAWAFANEYTSGKSATKFDPEGDLTAQQFATFLLRALGYEIDAKAYETAFETAVELGLFEGLNLEKETVLKRKHMAMMTFNALYVPMKDSEVTLGEFLELELPQEEPEVPATLEAEVVADNLKSFMVVFNQPVKSASVKAKTTSDIKVETKLSEDKTALVGYYENDLTQSASVTFTINAETEEGLKLEDFEVKKTVNDVTIPAALSARALNPKQIEILFSEPVQLEVPNAKLLSGIKVDDKEVVAESSVNYFDNTVIITLLAPMTEGTKKLEISKVKDYANFVAPTAEFDITVVKDEDAPVAVSAEVKNNKEIVITFNEPLSKAAIGTYTVDGKEATPAFVVGTNYTQVKLTLKEELSIGAVVEVKIGYKGQKDIMGNEVKQTTYITTRVEDDTTLPTVELTKVESSSNANKLTLTFSKPMAQTGKYQILDKDGKVVVGETNIPTFKANTNNTVLEIGDLLGGTNPAQYSIKLIDMKDASIRQNPLGTVTLEFTTVDTERPTVDSTYKYVAATEKNSANKYENKITIYFSEAMNKETIENLANYRLVSTKEPLHVDSQYTKAVAAADNKSVTIYYVTDDVTDSEESKYNEEIEVLTTVKDEAGNTLARNATVRRQTTVTLNILGNAQITKLNEIKVTFNTPIATVYPSLFSINDEYNYFTNAKIDGNTVIFTTARDLQNGKDYELTVTDVSLIVNKFGEKLTHKLEEKVPAVDNVAPTVKVAKDTDTTIKFTFSEEVEVSANDFINNLMARKSNGSVIDKEVVTAVYKVGDKDTQRIVGDAVYSGKVFIVHVDLKKLEVTKVTDIKVGFPVSTGNIKDKKGIKMLPTEWLEVK